MPKPEPMSPAPVFTPIPPDVTQRVREAIERLKERGALKDDRCPQCGIFNWEVDFLAIPSIALPIGGLNIPHNVMQHVAVGQTSNYVPALMLVCRNCGNTIIFNLKVLGLLGGE